MSECDYCHRPGTGRDFCPHAVDKRYDCPRKIADDRERKRRKVRKYYG